VVEWLQANRGRQSGQLMNSEGYRVKRVCRGGFVTIALLSALIIMSGCGATQQEPGGIEGTVTDINGEPVAGMMVSIVSGTTGFPEILAITNEDGHYGIGSVPPGKFDVAVHDEEGNRIGLESVVVRSGGVSDLDFATPVQEVSEEVEPAEEWNADGLFGNREYRAETKYGDYEIRWASDDKYLYVGIKAKTTGWVAVGIEPSFKMKDADMVFGFVKDGETTISDAFSTGAYGPHAPDTELGGTDDILEFGGKEEGGFTIIEFKRALNTGDKYDKELSNGANRIIWAYGSTDKLTEKHTRRGYGEMTL